MRRVTKVLRSRMVGGRSMCQSAYIIQPNIAWLKLRNGLQNFPRPHVHHLLSSSAFDAIALVVVHNFALKGVRWWPWGLKSILAFQHRWTSFVMPFFVPVLRLSMLFLNIYDSYKVLKRPQPSARNGGQPSQRALSQRKRDMKGSLAVWIVWVRCLLALLSSRRSLPTVLLYHIWAFCGSCCQLVCALLRWIQISRHSVPHPHASKGRSWGCGFVIC